MVRLGALCIWCAFFSNVPQWFYPLFKMQLAMLKKMYTHGHHIVFIQNVFLV